MQIQLEVPNLEVFQEVKRRLAGLDVAYTATEATPLATDSTLPTQEVFTTPDWEALGPKGQQFILEGIAAYKAGKAMSFEAFEAELERKGL